MHDPRERPYHHGDLKRALVKTAQKMLLEGEGWHFTLREVARRAGVSHAAPYKHFADKTALLAEIAAQGHLKLRDDLKFAPGRTGKPPQTEIVAVATAYMEFGRANSSLYRLMFSSEINKADHGGLAEASSATFEVLIDILSRGQQAGVFRRQSLQGQAAACWAIIHGLTILELNGQLGPEKVGTKPVDSALASLLEGLLA